MGCTVELQEINESGQFPAMADGDVDATLEVWPSGHLKDRKDYIEKAGTVVDGGELGIIGNIGWFIPSYVVDENPDLATWEGFKENADEFATAETGDKGRFLGADTTYSIFDEAIIESLGLDLEVVYCGIRGGVARGARQGLQQRGPHPDVLVDAAVGQRQVRPGRGRAPRLRRGVRRDRGGGPGCGRRLRLRLRRGRLYKAFSAELETKDPAAFAFLSNFDWTEEDQNGVALAIQEGTDPSEAAQTWIDANPDVVQSWLPAGLSRTAG